MPGPDHRTSTEHNCSEVIDFFYSSHPDLKDSPSKNADNSCFTDGNSLVKKGNKKSWLCYSAHSCFAIAISLKINIYTASKYAFIVLYAHTAI